MDGEHAGLSPNKTGSRRAGPAGTGADTQRNKDRQRWIDERKETHRDRTETEIERQVERIWRVRSIQRRRDHQRRGQRQRRSRERQTSWKLRPPTMHD